MSSAPMGKVVMVQGTSSHSGKSTLAAALCRIFAREGLRVVPFKAQNMSLNSHATPDGGEIGRSQAVQAVAAMTEATVDMNPVLLKPEGEQRSQVVVLGRPRPSTSVRDYYRMKPELWGVVSDALARLRAEYDVVVIEGAGSPAEINLRQHDIVNMRLARSVDAPVLLVGDIERGGVFAQLVGTMELLEAEERALVKAFVINKFRGDPEILAPGLDMLRERTGVPVAGVLPYFTDVRIPEEDSLGLDVGDEANSDAVLDVGVVRFPHLSNFDDFDPIRREPGVSVRYIADPDSVAGSDLVIIPGTKTTMADLHWMRRQGLDRAVVDARRRGIPVVGICGGYQILGERLLDPDGIESETQEAQGIGLLPVTTVFQGDKATHRVAARVAGSATGLLQGCAGVELTGYEIHMGFTRRPDHSPFVITTRSGKPAGEPDGATDREGLALGTYMHGLFHNRTLRRSVLEHAAERKGVTLPEGGADTDLNADLDRLASIVSSNLDMDFIYRVSGLK